MQNQIRNSPINMKIKAVKGELEDLDAEINSITLELSDIDAHNQINNKYKTMPINSTPIKTRIKANQISYKTPDFNRKHILKFSPKNSPQTVKTNGNSTLYIEDLMSSDNEENDADNKGANSGSQNESNSSQTSSDSTNNSPSKFSSPSSHKTANKSPHDDEKNHLFLQSVKIIEKRTHSLFNKDLWPQNPESENDNDKNNNNFSQQEFVEDEEFYFPKQSTFSYNEKGRGGFKSISEMDRINETHLKREKMALIRQKEKERNFEENYTFKPVLSTPVISPEKERLLRIKQQQQAQRGENSQTTPKSIRFINPNSEKIAKKAKLKSSSSLNKSDTPDKRTQSPKVKQLTKKQLKKSCERLSKPRPVSSENWSTDSEEDEDKKKFADPKAIERLYQSSTKQKKVNLNDEREDAKNQSARRSFIDSTSQKIIDKTAKNRNSNDLFEESVQVAEDRLNYSKEMKKYNEMKEVNLCTFRPKINRTPPHFTANNTDYSSMLKNQCYSTFNTPKAKRDYYNAKSSQESPLRKSYIVSPKKEAREKRQVSEDEIQKILQEVDQIY